MDRTIPLRFDLAWELGGHTGHVTTLLPFAQALRARGHAVRFLLKSLAAGEDLEGMDAIERVAAPIWVGPHRFQNPRNFGEILTNFGYADPPRLHELIEAWRERLAGTAAVIANVAPAAHVAARTLGVPSFEISQGFHIPPPTMPSPPLRHWEPAPRAELEAADRAVLAAINDVLRAYAVAPLATIGDLFEGRAMLLTYPELDIYPERGPAEYFGIPRAAEGRAHPEWPRGRGRRVLGYLYQYYEGLPRLLEALEGLDMPTLLLCRGADAALKARFDGGPVRLLATPMAVTQLLSECDLVICHGSHQMSAQSLLAGRPMLMLPTQLEQFLITRHAVRYGAALGVVDAQPDADYAAALHALTNDAGYAEKARAFAQRYAGHDRNAALDTMVKRCEAAVAAKNQMGPTHA
jgi:UDP:flavonoid glycosyltransferase YjiC (YdhE family)